MIVELSWNNLVPELIQDSGVARLEVGAPVCFCLSKERECTGIPEYGVQIRSTCSLGSVVPQGRDSQCDYCRRRDVTLTAKTGYGSSDRAIALLNSDHVVYLALFSGDLIKVGVELWDRRQIRVTEQGALACMFVARGTGVVARNLERRIHNLAGFTEWVRVKTKLSGLSLIVNSEKAEEILYEAYKKVLNYADSTAIIEPKFLYLVDRYNLSEKVGLLPIESLEKVYGGAMIRGTTEGIYGKIILFANRGRLYALNSNLMCGYSLMKPCVNGIDSDLVGVTTRLVTDNRQQSLF